MSLRDELKNAANQEKQTAREEREAQQARWAAQLLPAWEAAEAERLKLHRQFEGLCRAEGLPVPRLLSYRANPKAYLNPSRSLNGPDRYVPVVKYSDDSLSICTFPILFLLEDVLLVLKGAGEVVRVWGNCQNSGTQYFPQTSPGTPTLFLLDGSIYKPKNYWETRQVIVSEIYIGNLPDLSKTSLAKAVASSTNHLDTDQLLRQIRLTIPEPPQGS